MKHMIAAIIATCVICTQLYCQTIPTDANGRPFSVISDLEKDIPNILYDTSEKLYDINTEWRYNENIEENTLKYSSFILSKSFF